MPLIYLEDEVLIERVKERPVIYDSKQNGYKNTKQKELHWEAISQGSTESGILFCSVPVY